MYLWDVFLWYTLDSGIEVQSLLTSQHRVQSIKLRTITNVLVHIGLILRNAGMAQNMTKCHFYIYE